MYLYGTQNATILLRVIIQFYGDDPSKVTLDETEVTYYTDQLVTAGLSVIPASLHVWCENNYGRF